MSAGRNDPCPCGSGRKFKHCCGAGPARTPTQGAAPAPSHALAASHYNEGVALHGRGRLGEAVDRYRQALALDAGLDVAHTNLGNALAALGRFDEAARSYRQALTLAPQNVDTRYNLAVSLHSQGALGDAAAQYRDVIARSPAHAQAHFNLGIAMRDLGRLREAAASFGRVVALRPDIAEGHASLGQVLQSGGDLAGAIGCYREALRRKPGDAAIHNNLGNALHETADAAAALASYRRALALAESPEIRSNFARCLRDADAAALDADLRPLLIRAIDEAWTRPADLARVAAGMIDANAGMASLADDPLLRALLVSAPVCDMALERSLVATRRALLDAASHGTAGAPLDFACALARQCAIDEYVWPIAADENAAAAALRGRIVAALAADGDVPPAWVAAVGAYASLAELPDPAALLAREWPDSVRALLAQQVAEPLAERRDRDAIPRLTAIDDAVSAAVRAQYEESPYPRWVRSPAVATSPSFDAFVRQQFPATDFTPRADDRPLDILVAGCGTGQEAIEMARQFPSARVLAVDLSLASLAYARRKGRELGLANLEFGQADVLHAASLAQTFDVISSVGVLHHLARPEDGLRALLTRLRPDGFLRLGLYSERARRDVVAARAFIAECGYRATADDIRRCRQDIVAQGGTLAQLALRRDFYSISECRDLLFHVQEHRYTLPVLAAMLAGAGVRFVGFLLEPSVLRRYAARFPDDPAATDLARWDAFEAEHPDTFRGMYRFWVQTPTSA